jgi:putative alpha-1,2-mannosidase
VTRYLVDHAYTAAADGIPGNDDYGTMSAWLVWASVGLYPLAGSDTFVVGSPRFAHVRIRVGGESAGPWLDIVAHNASGRNLYVERATINGDVLEAPLLTFSQLVRPRNATLELWMGADPAMAAWSEGGLLMM